MTHMAMLRRLLGLAAALALAPAPALAEDALQRAAEARLASAPSASEYWDLSARFETGHRIFARFMLTNEGFGGRTGVAWGDVVLPDGSTRPFAIAKQEGDWSLSEDRLRLEIGSAHLDLRTAERRFELDSRKLRLRIALRFPADGPGVAFPPGGALAPEVALLQISRVEGEFSEPGMPAPVALVGRGALARLWLDGGEGASVRRWISFAGEAGGLDAFASVVMGADAVQHGWLALRRGDEILVRDAAAAVAVEIAGAAAEPGYPRPERVSLEGAGARVRLEAGPEWVRRDPTERLIAPLRLLLRLKTRPRLLLSDASLHISLGAASRQAHRGAGNLWTTYVNPLQ